MMTQCKESCFSETKVGEGDDGMRVYLIRIQGHLDAGWVEWFDGFTFTLEDSGETLMCGHVADQAALFGVLRKIRDLGMPLVSLQSVQKR
jgi:hypothetical protein